MLHPPTLLLALLATTALAAPQTASIFIQPVVRTALPPAPLAEITYDVSTTDHTAEITAFEYPELFDEGNVALVRIGAWNATAGDWTGAVSVASTESFGKGYSPHFVLSVAGRDGERVLGAACRGVKVDAGATRDFGPQAAVVLGDVGREPSVNRPVVLSPEGKKVDGEPEEKTFLQKYYWYIVGLLLFMLFSGGGGAPEK